MSKSKFDGILSSRNTRSKPLPKSRDDQYIKANFYLPKELHKKLKALAVQEEQDMSDILASVLEDFFAGLDS